MPQKVTYHLLLQSNEPSSDFGQKNADSLELLRGKSGTVFGLMCGVNMSIKVRSTPKP